MGKRSGKLALSAGSHGILGIIQDRGIHWPEL